MKNALLATIAARNHQLLATRETSSRHPRMEAPRRLNPGPGAAEKRRALVHRRRLPHHRAYRASAGRRCLPRGRSPRAPVRVRRGATSRERRLHPLVPTPACMGRWARQREKATSLVGTRAGLACPLWRASLRTSRGSGSRRPARDAGPRDAAASDAVASLERRAGTPRMKRRPRTKRWRVRRRRSRARLIEFGVGTSAGSAR